MVRKGAAEGYKGVDFQEVSTARMAIAHGEQKVHINICGVPPGKGEGIATQQEDRIGEQNRAGGILTPLPHFASAFAVLIVSLRQLRG